MIILRHLWLWLLRRVIPPDRIYFDTKGLPMLPINSTDDFVKVPLRATRKNLPWPLPADIAVVSSDPAVATAALADGVTTVTRAGEPAGTVQVIATGGGLSATLEVQVAAATADALVFDENAATRG